MAQSWSSETPRSETPTLNDENDTEFLKKCAAEFRWNDLSKDYVMDIGCGAEMGFSKALLKEYPKVSALVAVDKEPTVFLKAGPFDQRLHLCVGDIEERNSLKQYEGKISKVISKGTFHQIKDKELAFQNVYRLLKPGGEAAFLFCLECSFYRLLTSMLKVPKLKAMFQGIYIENLYPKEHGKQYYIDMLTKIGFQNVRASEELKRIPFSSDEQCRNYLFEIYKDEFRVQSEMVEEFKDEAFQICLSTSGRYLRKPYYRASNLNLCGVKPLESSDSKTEQT
ncbi:hypothetical protein NPIL_440471 [Nephila pilipes]|uniref:Methyltransferase domain-containing protein n=1 Tax=Nephila pilipes TaxID=299642 RepID=A0A8X6P9P0_NEPPI|nr:hypothetical protein NPIL_440471 [Nephila pilipes]